MGLLGLRLGDLQGLTWNMARPDGSWAWTGKGNRIRVVHPGPVLVELTHRWRRFYQRQTDVALTDLPVFCRFQGNAHALWPQPGRRLAKDAIPKMLLLRSGKADLGHIAPHDLRRTCADLLHSDRSPDGGHRYDLADIQRALGHASPTTTERSYLGPVRTETLQAAGRTVDL